MKSFLEKNLYYLSNIDSILAKRIAKVNLDEKVKILETPTGFPSLKAISYDGVEIQLHSFYDPIIEARQFMESKELGNTDMYALSGFGLGYHAIELANRLRKKNWLLLIEAREDIFRMAMEFIDLSAILSRPRTRFFVGQSWPSFLGWLKDFLNESESEDTTLTTYAPSFRILPQFYINVANEMTSAINRRKVELFTLLKNGKLLEENAIHNLPEIVKSVGVKSFYNCFEGIPAIVVAAGPSLNQSVDLLHKVKGKAFIICVGKVLKLLFDKGIIPEFTATLDMLPSSKVCFDGLDKLKDVILIFDPDSYHRIVSNYPGAKVNFETIINLSKWMYYFISDKGDLEKGLSVAHTAFFFARHTGANPIILVGVDLSFPTDKTHAEGVTQTWGGNFNESDPDIMMVPLVTGGQVRTLKSFQSFINAFEIEIEKTNATVINTSHFGALIRGTTNMSFQDAIAKYCFTEKPINEKIQSILKEKRNFDKEAFRSYSPTLLNEIEQIIEISERGLKYTKRLYKLDRTNKIDEQEFNNIGNKVNKLRLEILKHHKTALLLQRILVNEALQIKEISETLEETDRNNIKQITKLELERFELFFKGYLSASEFFQSHFKPVREKPLSI